MKNIFLCCAVVAFLSSSPAFAADPSAAQSLPTVQSPTTDFRQLVGEIDLRVLLQHYEKLKTELQETQLQMALHEAGALEPAATQSDKNMTPGERDAALKKHEESMLIETKRLRARFEVLHLLADTTRKEAEALAAELAARRNSANPRATSFQPRS